MPAFVASNATWNTTAGNKGVAPTPAVGELLVAFVAEAGLTTGYAVSDNQTGGTYTQIGSFALNNTSVDSIGVWIRDNLVASAVSHSINTTGATASTGGGLAVLRVSGMTRAGLAAARTVAGVVQFAKQQNQAAGTPAPVFPAAALTANMVVGAVLTASNSTTNTAPPTGWTEQHDLGFNTPTTGLEVATRDSGETGTTITWTAATPSIFASIIIELEAGVPDAELIASEPNYNGLGRVSAFLDDEDAEHYDYYAPLHNATEAAIAGPPAAGVGIAELVAADPNYSGAPRIGATLDDVDDEPYDYYTASRPAIDIDASPIFTTVADYSDLVYRDGARGYWRLDEPSGTNVFDSSDNGLTGTWNGTPTQNVPGLIDGPDTAAITGDNFTYVDLSNPASLRLTNEFSLEGWVKVRSGVTQESAFIAHEYNGATVNYMLGFFDGAASSLQPSVGFYNGAWHVAQSPDPISTNEPHHIVGTWDGAVLRIYVDGVLKNTNTPGSSPVTSTQRFLLDSRWDSTAPHKFDGTSDELAIYGGALSAAQIAEHFAVGTSGRLAAAPYSVLEPYADPEHDDFDYWTTPPEQTESFVAGPSVVSSDDYVATTAVVLDHSDQPDEDEAFDFYGACGSSLTVDGFLAPHETDAFETFEQTPGAILTAGNTVFTTTQTTAGVTLASNERYVGGTSYTADITRATFGSGTLLFGTDGYRTHNRFFQRFDVALSRIGTALGFAWWDPNGGVGPYVGVNDTGHVTIFDVNAAPAAASSLVVTPEQFFRVEILWTRKSAASAIGFDVVIAVFLDPTGSVADETITAVGIDGGSGVGDVTGPAVGITTFGSGLQSSLGTWIDDYAISTKAFPTPTGTAAAPGAIPSRIANASWFEQETAYQADPDEEHHNWYSQRFDGAVEAFVAGAPVADDSYVATIDVPDASDQPDEDDAWDFYCGSSTLLDLTPFFPLMTGYTARVMALSPTYYFKLDGDGHDYANGFDADVVTAAFDSANTVGPDAVDDSFYGASYDGAGGHVVRKNGIAAFFDSDYTVEAWMNPTTITAARRLWELGNGSFDDPMFVAWDTGTVFKWDVGGTRINFTLIETNVYRHVVAVYRRGGTSELWIDGVMVGTQTFTHPTTSTQPFVIGNTGGAPSSDEFIGFIDEFAIYPRALAANEIVGNYLFLRAATVVNEVPTEPVVDVQFPEWDYTIDQGPESTLDTTAAFYPPAVTDDSYVATTWVVPDTTTDFPDRVDDTEEQAVETVQIQPEENVAGSTPAEDPVYAAQTYAEFDVELLWPDDEPISGPCQPWVEQAEAVVGFLTVEDEIAGAAQLDPSVGQDDDQAWVAGDPTDVAPFIDGAEAILGFLTIEDEIAEAAQLPRDIGWFSEDFEQANDPTDIWPFLDEQEELIAGPPLFADDGYIATVDVFDHSDEPAPDDAFDFYATTQEGTEWSIGFLAPDVEITIGAQPSRSEDTGLDNPDWDYTADQPYVEQTEAVVGFLAPDAEITEAAQLDRSVGQDDDQAWIVTDPTDVWPFTDQGEAFTAGPPTSDDFVALLAPHVESVAVDFPERIDDTEEQGVEAVHIQPEEYVAGSTPADDPLYLAQTYYELDIENAPAPDDAFDYSAAAGFVSTFPAYVPEPPQLRYDFDAFTLGLADGAPVGTWPDASGRGSDAVQPTGSLQPLYVAAAINGHPAVRGDGTDDQLPVTNYTSDLQAWTIMAVVAPEVGDATSEDVITGGAAPGNSWFVDRSSSVGVPYAGIAVRTSSGLNNLSGLGTAGIWPDRQGKLVTFVYDPTAGRSIYDGLQLVASDADTTHSDPPTTMFLFSRGGSLFFQGLIGQVRLWNYVLDPATRATEQQNLLTKWFDVADEVAEGQVTDDQASPGHYEWPPDATNEQPYVEQLEAFVAGSTAGADPLYLAQLAPDLGWSPEDYPDFDPSIDAAALPTAEVVAWQFIGLRVWLDTTQIVGKLDGDPVSTWPDQTGLGYNATAGAGAEPRYTAAGLNGLPVLLTDGVNDQMDIAGLILGANVPRTIYMVGYRAQAALPPGPPDMWAISSVAGLMDSTNAGYTWATSEAAGTPVIGSLDPRDAQLLTVRITDAATLDAWTMGLGPITIDPNDAAFGAINGLAIFHRPGNSGLGQFAMGEFRIYAGAHTDAERQVIETELLAKWFDVSDYEAAGQLGWAGLGWDVADYPEFDAAPDANATTDVSAFIVGPPSADDSYVATMALVPDASDQPAPDDAFDFYAYPVEASEWFIGFLAPDAEIADAAQDHTVGQDDDQLWTLTDPTDAAPFVDGIEYLTGFLVPADEIAQAAQLHYGDWQDWREAEQTEDYANDSTIGVEDTTNAPDTFDLTAAAQPDPSIGQDWHLFPEWDYTADQPYASELDVAPLTFPADPDEVTQAAQPTAIGQDDDALWTLTDPTDIAPFTEQAEGFIAGPPDAFDTTIATQPDPSMGQDTDLLNPPDLSQLDTGYVEQAEAYVAGPPAFAPDAEAIASQPAEIGIDVEGRWPEWDGTDATPFLDGAEWFIGFTVPDVEITIAAQPSRAEDTAVDDPDRIEWTEETDPATTLDLSPLVRADDPIEVTLATQLDASVGQDDDQWWTLLDPTDTTPFIDEQEEAIAGSTTADDPIYAAQAWPDVSTTEYAAEETTDYANDTALDLSPLTFGPDAFDLTIATQLDPSAGQDDDQGWIAADPTDIWPFADQLEAFEEIVTPDEGIAATQDYGDDQYEPEALWAPESLSDGAVEFIASDIEQAFLPAATALCEPASEPEDEAWPLYVPLADQSGEFAATQLDVALVAALDVPAALVDEPEVWHPEVALADGIEIATTEIAVAVAAQPTVEAYDWTTFEEPVADLSTVERRPIVARPSAQPEIVDMTALVDPGVDLVALKDAGAELVALAESEGYAMGPYGAPAPDHVSALEGEVEQIDALSDPDVDVT